MNADCITEILCRLPVKSLLRFKSVSTSWNHLITSPYFVKKHLQCKKERILLCLNPVNSYPLNDLLNEEPIVGETNKFKERVLMVYGSVNGLILSRQGIRRNTPKLQVWNPSMGESKRLPNSPFDFDIPGFEQCYRAYCIGVDPVGRDYKVLKMVKFRDSSGVTFCKGSVFSLRRNLWSVIHQEFPHNSFDEDSRCHFMNDGFHFLASKDGANLKDKGAIICLKTSNHMYCHMNTPDLQFEGSKPIRCELVTLREMLCLFCAYETTECAIWGMKQYGLDSSWTLLGYITGCNDLFKTLQPKYLWGESIFSADFLVLKVTGLYVQQGRNLITRGFWLGEMKHHVERHSLKAWFHPFLKKRSS